MTSGRGIIATLRYGGTVCHLTSEGVLLTYSIYSNGHMGRPVRTTLPSPQRGMQMLHAVAATHNAEVLVLYVPTPRPLTG